HKVQAVGIVLFLGLALMANQAAGLGIGNHVGELSSLFRSLGVVNIHLNPLIVELLEGQGRGGTSDEQQGSKYQCQTLWHSKPLEGNARSPRRDGSRGSVKVGGSSGDDRNRTCTP